MNDIAPKGSICEICGKPAPWQMYCKNCGYILRFYCGEHAYLSQGDENLEKKVKKANGIFEHPKLKSEIKKAKDEWESYLVKVNGLNHM